jgi:hypothetical protein
MMTSAGFTPRACSQAPIACGSSYAPTTPPDTITFSARPARYTASAVSRRASSSGQGVPSGSTRLPSTIAYGRRGAASTVGAMAERALAIR